MAMKVLIVEDEIMAQKSLIRILTQNFADMEIVGTTGSVKGTVSWLNDPANKADVIFMDVELSDGECFEIFRQTEVKSKVIMTTAYDTYAIKAFEAGSIDYLLKPIDPTALKRAVARCRMSGGQIDSDALLKALQSNIPSKREYKERYIIRFNDNHKTHQDADQKSYGLIWSPEIPYIALRYYTVRLHYDNLSFRFR